MSVSIGIDLGTTYSCVIAHHDDGRETIVPAVDGGALTPSVVHFGADGTVSVGEDAKRQVAADPDGVVSGIKRYMGHEHPLTFGQDTYTPEGISGIILRHLARDASEALSVESVDLAAVITVPAYFGAAEKEATSAAARIAGLRCLELLAEPVAAAYGYGLADQPEVTSLVFDLGGGTFDVAVVGMDRGTPRVWAVDGETQLGGLDWDERVRDLLWSRVDDVPGGEDLRFDEDVIGVVEAAGERLKRALTARTEVTERFRFGGELIELTLTRPDFEEMSRDLVGRCLETVDRVLVAGTAAGASRVTQVLLVGGSTRMPMIKEALARHLDVPVLLADPDKAVARGAAVLARQLCNARSDAGAGGGSVRRIVPVLPRSIGIEVRSSRAPHRTEPVIQHFLEANTPLPIVGVRQVVATIADNQERARIQLYEQSGSVVSEDRRNNRLLLDGEIVGIPPGPAGSPLSLFVSVGIDGRITAMPQGADGRNLAMEAFIHGVLDDAELAAQSAVVASLRLDR